MSLSAVHRSLRAFTLLELMVGMIVSGIVLTATFSAFHIVSRQTETYKSGTNSTESLSFFISQLQSDFSNAKKIMLVSGNELQLEFPDRKLNYRFMDKFVLHTDGIRTDSFAANVTALSAFFHHEKIEDGECDAVQLTLGIDGKKENFQLERLNDAKTAMDAEEVSDGH